MASNKRVVKLSEYIAHGSNVTACTIGHKSNRIAATGGEDKKVNLWTLNKSTCIMSLTGHTSAVHSITFSSNEDKIVSGSASGSLKVWDLEVSKPICNLVGHKATVTCLEYHNYADYIASGSVDAQIRLWDLRRKGCIFTYKGHTNSINSLRFSPDSKWIASVSEDNLVKIWDLKAGRLLIDLKGHTGSVNSLEFHPNEFLLATGSSDRTVKFWDLEKMENVSTSPQSPSAIKQIIFEQNGKCLFAASQDYLQSVSWEPSECHDSVFCQWKQVSDMTTSGNKLTAVSFNQNTISFYMVDLLQVAPIGVPPSTTEPEYRPSPSSAQPAICTNINNKSHPSRKNFHPYDKIEASEQAPDSDEQNESNAADTAQADICNVDEYNKIFRPQKEIRRPTSSSSISSIAAGGKKPSLHANLHNKKSADDLGGGDKSPAVDQSFFVDIKVAPAPKTPPAHSALNPLPPIKQEPVVTSYVKNNDMPTFEPQAAVKPEKLEEVFEKVNINDFMPSIESQTKSIAMDLVQTIEVGHESSMKALRSRFKNIQTVRQLWINGNIKYAMEMAVNMNDISIMADVLNQINQSVNIWNLDICLTLLPSIKELISSKYEDHAQIGSDSCKIIFKNFGKLIKSSLTGVVSVGVDLTREERQRKCNSCYGYFQDIISIIERKMPGITSQKLINNFREINLLMKTLET